MKTYTNKSNAARSAKSANGGTLDGLTLQGTEGAWYYAAPAALKVVRTADGGTAVVKNTPAPKAKKAVPAKVAAKKAVPAAKAKKAAPKAKAAAVEAYDPKHGDKQGRIVGYSIDPERDEQHGVRRRSAGTIGGRLWAIYDKLAAKAGGPEKLEIAVVKAHKDVEGFNANKVVIEFYYWRRHAGVRGRGSKQKVD